MNVQKLIAIVVAVAINCAVLAWFHAWSAAIVANAAGSPSASRVITLPAVNVYPSAEQVRTLRRARAAPTTSQADAAGNRATGAMPYYSFATLRDATVSG